MTKVKLEELVGGALQEKFEKSFDKVIENLLDPNTPYKPSRVISIKLAFAQNESRDDVKVSLDVSEKLAPQSGLSTAFSIGTDLKTGKIYAEEYGKQVKGQMSFSDYEIVDNKAVDTETGEIVTDQIVDFRKVSVQ